MPYNGSGGFESIGAPYFPAVPNTTILADQFNLVLADIFAGLGQVITRDGQSPATANLPMGGNKHTGAANANATGQYLVYGQTSGLIGNSWTFNGTNYTWSGNPTHSGNHTFSGAVTVGGTLTASGALAASGALTVAGVTTLNGNMVFGDAGTDTLAIAPSAVTWSNNPTHSGNHTFSGNLTVQGAATLNGNMVFGNAASDTLTIASSAVTWSGNPTHSGTHTFSGTVNAGAFAGPGGSLTGLNANNLTSGTVPDARLVGAYTGFTDLTGSGTAAFATFLGSTTASATVPRFSFTGDADTGIGRSAPDALALIAGGVNRLGITSTEVIFNLGAITWSVAPTHSGNHTFSGRIDVGQALRQAAVSVAFSTSPIFNSALANTFLLGTLTANVVSMSITNPTQGQFVSIRVKQDGTGGRTVAVPSGAKVVGAVGIAANQVSYLNVTYNSTDARWEGSWLVVPV